MEADSRFPARQRLRLKRDFDAVFSKGRSAADGNLVVYVLPNSLGYSRLGMAVGRKHGNATERNRIKRLIREAFRQNRAGLPGTADIVAVPRSGGCFGFSELAESLMRLAASAAEKSS